MADEPSRPPVTVSRGRPVLLIHGTGAWSEIWRRTFDTLAAQGYIPAIEATDRFNLVLLAFLENVAR